MKSTEKRLHGILYRYLIEEVEEEEKKEINSSNLESKLEEYIACRARSSRVE